jgi:hypothetical protein
MEMKWWEAKSNIIKLAHNSSSSDKCGSHYDLKSIFAINWNSTINYLIHKIGYKYLFNHINTRQKSLRTIW